MNLFSKMMAPALAIVAFTPSAFALDGADFADKMFGMFSAGRLEITYDQASVTGDTVTISGVTLTPPDEDPVDVPGNLVFTGVSETGDGGYTAEKGTMDDFTIPGEDADVTFSNLVVENLNVPAKPLSDPLENMHLYSKVSVGPITVDDDNGQIVSIGSITIDNAPTGSDKTISGTFDVKDIDADLASRAEADVKPVMTQFGLETLHGNLHSAYSWDLDTGHLEVTEAALQIDNVGKLMGTFDLRGYDLDLITKMQQIQADLGDEAQATPDEQKAANEKVGQLMLDNLALAGASLRFDDGSVTKKVLQLLAEQNGATPEVMAMGFAAMAPAFAKQAGAPAALQQDISKAAATYLADPQNLEVRAAPAEPVPFKDLAAAAETPDEVVTLLNLSVTANQ